MLGFPMLYFKGRRIMMFQLSDFYCMRVQDQSGAEGSGSGAAARALRTGYLEALLT